MNRRMFLGLATTAAAGLAVDPERLLWVPGQKVTFDLGSKPAYSMWWLDAEKVIARSPNARGTRRQFPWRVGMDGA